MKTALSFPPHTLGRRRAELTAGLNGGQQRAIGQLEGAYGTARPFFDGGTQQLANASGGLGNVSNYLQAGSESTAGVQPYQAAASNQYGQANNLIGNAITGLGGVSAYQNAAADSYGAMGGMIGSADTAYGQARYGRLRRCYEDGNVWARLQRSPMSNEVRQAVKREHAALIRATGAGRFVLDRLMNVARGCMPRCAR